MGIFSDGLNDLDWGSILNTLLNALFYIIDFLFGWLHLPTVPDSVWNIIDSFFDLIFDNLSLLGFFIRPTTLNLLIDLTLYVLSFYYIYKVVMWFLHKLPFLDIK